MIFFGRNWNPNLDWSVSYKEQPWRGKWYRFIIYTGILQWWNRLKDRDDTWQQLEFIASPWCHIYGTVKPRKRGDMNWREALKEVLPRGKPGLQPVNRKIVCDNIIDLIQIEDPLARLDAVDEWLMSLPSDERRFVIAIILTSVDTLSEAFRTLLDMANNTLAGIYDDQN